SACRHPELLRLCHLAAWRVADDEMIERFRHRGRDLSTKRLDRLLGLTTRELRERSSEQERLAGERQAIGRGATIVRDLHLQCGGLALLDELTVRVNLEPLMYAMRDLRADTRKRADLRLGGVQQRVR